MNHLRNGFFFGLGLLPLVVFSVWLFHNWPLFSPEIGAVDGFMFDRSQIQVGDAKLSRTEAGIRILSEVTNRSVHACGFIQLDCDLRLEGKVIAHEMAVVSNLAGRSSRGFTVTFSDVPDTIDVSKLRVQTSIAQALNLNDESVKEEITK
jgi:hypothetical protein